MGEASIFLNLTLQISFELRVITLTITNESEEVQKFPSVAQDHSTRKWRSWDLKKCNCTTKIKHILKSYSPILIIYLVQILGVKGHVFIYTGNSLKLSFIHSEKLKPRVDTLFELGCPPLPHGTEQDVNISLVFRSCFWPMYQISPAISFSLTFNLPTSLASNEFLLTTSNKHFWGEIKDNDPSGRTAIMPLV